MYTLVVILAMGYVAPNASAALGPDAGAICMCAMALCACMTALMDVRSRSMLSVGCYAVVYLALTWHLAESVDAYDAMHAGGGFAGELAPLLAYIFLPLSVAAAPVGELLRRAR